MVIAGSSQSVPPGPVTYTFTRNLDRTFDGQSPAWGPVRDGNNDWDPATYVHNGTNFELWQIIPFVDVTHGTVGNARIQLRNRDTTAAGTTLAMAPDRLVISSDNWTSSPWTFNRGNIIGNPGGSNPTTGRQAIDYTPVRSITGAAATNGVLDGQEFTITLEYD